MADKYIYNNSGTLTEKEGTVSSTGVSEAGKVVALDTDGKLNESVMPTGVAADTLSITASEALSAGDLVNIYDNTGVTNVRKADAATNKEAHGFVKSAVNSGNDAFVYFDGSISGFTGLTPGAKQYLSGTTAGQVTATAPTTASYIVQAVGWATSPTTISFEPQDKIVLA